MFRVQDRWGIRKTWGLLGCVDADAPHLVVLGALSTSAMLALFGLRRLVYPTLWDSDKKSPAEAGLSSIDRVCRGGGKPTSQHRPAPLVSVSKARRSTGWQQREAKPRRRIDGAASGLVAQRTEARISTGSLKAAGD